MNEIIVPTYKKADLCEKWILKILKTQKNVKKIDMTLHIGVF